MLNLRVTVSFKTYSRPTLAPSFLPLDRISLSPSSFPSVPALLFFWFWALARHCRQSLHHIVMSVRGDTREQGGTAGGRVPALLFGIGRQASLDVAACRQSGT